MAPKEICKNCGDEVSIHLLRDHLASYKSGSVDKE